MSNINEQVVNFYNKFQEVKYDMSQANLEDVKNILDNYNKSVVVIDGVSYHYNIDPLEAACLNARYRELTGADHPTFINEQNKVLDKLIATNNGVSVDGKPTIYQRLKNNLTGEGQGISIITNKQDSYISKFDKIQTDISQASLEDVKSILDYYDQDSILIDGAQYHFKPTALQGASLNARYKELTGEDHPKYVASLQIKNVAVENHDSILNRTDEILANPQGASLEDISSLLNYYNGKPVIIDGVARYPFNDPILATKLNARYKELTGQNHPVFVEQLSNVVDGLMKDKDMLISSGAYDAAYFDKLEQINQIIQESQENTQDTSIGGMSI